MIVRAIGCLCVSLAALCGAACYPVLPVAVVQTAPAKPRLIVVHSDACGPCRVFDQAFLTSRSLRETLIAQFEMEELDWDNPSQRADAQRLGVQQLPTFVLVRGQRVAAVHVGFAGSMRPEELRVAAAELMRSLQVPWPPQLTQERPQTPKAEPEASALQAAPAPPKTESATVDAVAREGIADLKQQARKSHEWQRETQQAVDQLQTQVAGVRSDLSESSRTITQQIRQSQDLTRKEMSSLSQQLQQTVQQTISLQTRDFSDVHSQSETPPAQSQPSQSSARGVVAGWLLKLGLTAGAASLGLPVGVAAVAATGIGWLIGRRRNRRNATQPPLHSVAASSGESHTVLRDSEVRTATANHYVVKETDRIGEAYKEALRRVVAAYKSDKPGVVDVASQIEHVAKELLRGQDVQARSSNAPRPGLWTDEGL